MSNPKIIPPGRGQGRNIPKGYILGRTSTGRGPVELLDLRALQTIGLASNQAIQAKLSQAGFTFNAGGTMASGEDLGSGTWAHNVTFENDVDGSSVVALIAPTSTATFDIYAIVGGIPTVVGTITFSAGQTTGVVNFPTSYTFVPGTIVRLNAPNPADPSLTSVSGTVMGFSS